MKAALLKLQPKIHIENIWGSTIYNKEDLPFKPETELPHIYGRFREKGEGTKVRPLVPAPSKGELPFPKSLDKEISKATKFMPDLVKDLKYKKDEV